MARVALIALGGTISSARSGPSGAVPRFDGRALAAGLALGDVEVEHHELGLQPSASLGPQQLVELAGEVSRLRPDVDGIVVTQGTDTLEETAFALDLLDTGARGAVVVTGAMRTHDAPGADGPANLAAAVRVAVSPEAAGTGALLVFADRIHAARWVRKARTFGPDAFSSAPLGPIGWIAEDRPRIELRPRDRERVPIPEGRIPPIAIVEAGGGDDLAYLDDLAHAGYRGLVVAGLGGGHVAAPAAEVLERVASRIPVVMASRTGSGPVLSDSYGYVGGDIDLVRRGVIPGGGLSAGRARVLLGVLLASGLDRTAVRDRFAQLS